MVIYEHRMIVKTQEDLSARFSFVISLHNLNPKTYFRTIG